MEEIKSVKVSLEGLEKISELREYVNRMLKHLNEELPNSREKSIAVTKLEEFSFFVIKAFSIKYEEK